MALLLDDNKFINEFITKQSLLKDVTCDIDDCVKRLVEMETWIGRYNESLKVENKTLK